jgi:hypothetical protein
MRKVWPISAALVLSVTNPAAAQAAEPDELGCIAATYSPEQQGEVDALLPGLDLLFQRRSAMLDQLSLIILASASVCDSTYDWSDAEQESAMPNELGRLMELALRRHGRLTGEDVARVDALLATGDRSALWAALERHIGIGLAGRNEAIAHDEAIVMGQFIGDTGVGPEERKIEEISVYLAAKTMQRISARAFAVQ